MNYVMWLKYTMIFLFIESTLIFYAMVVLFDFMLKILILLSYLIY